MGAANDRPSACEGSDLLTGCLRAAAAAAAAAAETAQPGASEGPRSNQLPDHHTGGCRGQAAGQSRRSSPLEPPVTSATLPLSMLKESHRRAKAHTVIAEL